MSITRRISRRIVLTGAVALLAALSISAAGAGAATRASGPPARTVSSSRAQATLVSEIALARIATAKYVSGLEQAKADGYVIITRMIPNMGYHYLNPNLKGFNVRKPAILVYEHRGTTWQLGALEWVFTSKPAKSPLPGAKFGTFGAACHYKDGTFVPSQTQDGCPAKSPQTGASFNFWHPLLYTLHVWLWYPNPSGLFASTNPLVAAFNKG